MSARSIEKLSRLTESIKGRETACAKRLSEFVEAGQSHASKDANGVVALTRYVGFLMECEHARADHEREAGDLLLATLANLFARLDMLEEPLAGSSSPSEGKGISPELLGPVVVAIGKRIARSEGDVVDLIGGVEARVSQLEKRTTKRAAR